MRDLCNPQSLYHPVSCILKGPFVLTNLLKSVPCRNKTTQKAFWPQEGYSAPWYSSGPGET